MTMRRNDPGWQRDPDSIDPVVVQRLAQGTRTDSSKLERRAAFQRLKDQGRYTHVEIARRIGVSKRTIERYQAQETA